MSFPRVDSMWLCNTDGLVYGFLEMATDWETRQPLVVFRRPKVAMEPSERLMSIPFSKWVERVYMVTHEWPDGCFVPRFVEVDVKPASRANRRRRLLT